MKKPLNITANITANLLTAAVLSVLASTSVQAVQFDGLTYHNDPPTRMRAFNFTVCDIDGEDSSITRSMSAA